MPQVYISKKIYDQLVKEGKNPSVFINDTMEKLLFNLKKDEGQKKTGEKKE